MRGSWVTVTDLGDADLPRHRLMKQFAHHVGDILALVADKLQPRDFDEFVRYGFQEPPASELP